MRFQLDVLAIFSHPDDAELTMAGTLLKLKSLGYRTGIADMTRGEMGTRGTPEIRAKEALDAARVMRLDARVNLGLPDGHLALNEENRLAVVRVLRKYQPKVVFTAHGTIRTPITRRPPTSCARLRDWPP